MKETRNAVRTFLIKENKVVCIKYKQGNVGYLDIPGGKIEEKEDSYQAAVREFKEETGMEISHLETLGSVCIEYPDRIYNMIVYLAYDFVGEPKEFTENESFWIDTNDLLKEEKRYAITYLLAPEFQDDFENRNIMHIFQVDENHNVLKFSRIIGLYDAEKVAKKEMNTRLDYAKKLGYDKGHAAGYEEGYNAGKLARKIEIAKNLLNENADISFISKVTGLTKEQIEELK